MVETLIKRLWPILKVRVVSLIADYLQAFAAKSHTTLSDDDAASLAVLIVELLSDLLNRDPGTDKLKKAARAIGAV